MNVELVAQIRKVRDALDGFERLLPNIGGFGEGPEFHAGKLRAEMALLSQMLGDRPPPKAPRWCYFRKTRRKA